MTEIAILLTAAAIAYGLARWLRLPPMPFLLGAGLIISVLDLAPDRTFLGDGIQLGLVFLVFAVGVELNPRRVGQQRATAMRVGAAQFVALGVIGFFTAASLGATAQEAIYIALAVAASSTLLVVRLLQHRRQMFEPFGRLVLGVLLLQDLLVILLLPVFAGVPEGIQAAAEGLAASVILVLLASAYLRWVAPTIILRLNLDEETLLLVTLATLFVFIGAAVWLDLPIVAGAFLAGVSLSSFPVGGIVRGQLASLSDFFLAVFLTALGGIIQMPEPRHLIMAAVLTAIVILVTPPLVTLIAERAGLSARASIDGGLLLAQTSEFSLVVALQGVSVGHLTEDLLLRSLRS